jgi:hypothetical protein
MDAESKAPTAPDYQHVLCKLTHDLWGKSRTASGDERVSATKQAAQELPVLPRG